MEGLYCRGWPSREKCPSPGHHSGNTKLNCLFSHESKHKANNELLLMRIKKMYLCEKIKNVVI